jgi:hypothetical protein
VIRRVALILGLAGVFVPAASAQPPTPIPSVSVPPAPQHVGSPAVAHPIRGIAPIPHNRFMAANGMSEIHDDGWQSDISTWGGPLGRSPHTFSN